ncbi:double-strand break repair helicase AddA [Jiella sp. M17.18]|uniref:double-strand break repair helicase AddA n=1 Tax=Jiella sp. M17.18 TaxID=3234247 RepID=UPI0034E029B8
MRDIAFTGIAETARRQQIAADPNLSVFVSANAGSGKTHVLTERVVRLLLAGNEPSKILCLTYTKAAAAEMSGRVFSRLSRWATAPDEVLSGEIAALDGREPSAERLAEARRLFAEAVETPGGLKIQTIHAFCEAILHQFPLEANVPGHFEVLDDTESAALLLEARRRLITSASRAEHSSLEERLLAESFSSVLALAGEFGLDQLLSEIVAKRDAIRRHIDEAGGLGPAIALLRRALRLEEGEDEAAILAEARDAPGFDDAFCQDVLQAAEASDKKTDQTLVERLKALTGAVNDAVAHEAMRSLCLTQKGAPYKAKSVATKAVTDRFSDFEERLGAFAAHVLAVDERLSSLQLFRASAGALAIADTLEHDYAALKRRRGRLDFEDLIVKTADLLTRAEASAWVHFKLDQGIDHVLIDEAQDTSPRQWQVMRQLTAEFFAGATARNVSRTVFAVGDEKQSIYSFQGASPTMFAEERAAMQKRAEAARVPFEAIALNQSFRTAGDVLAAVDEVFADAENRRGLTFTGEAPSHQTARGEAPGLVEVWPPFAAEASPQSRDWLQAIDYEPENSPANRLARRIAETIAGWIGDPIAHKGRIRPLTPGDVIVLVRKRSGFVAAMAKALRDAGIPVAGADRLVITDHIAVKDLMALGRTVANFDDDLSLAEALKSPFFDFSDDELMGLALSREHHEPLSLGLRRLTGAEGLARLPDFVPDATAEAFIAKCGAALERLETLRDRAGFETIFAFFARILGPEGGRAKLTARLGADAGEVIDAFLDLALAEEEAGEPGLDAFLSRLVAAPPTIKREMEQGRGEVRIMTAHASKGLEAPVVFLVDPGSAPFHAAHGAKLMAWPDMPGLAPGQAPGFLWRGAKALENDVVAALKEAEKQRAEEEYRRLLYVGMTRAADRLVVCGLAGWRGPNETAWLQRVQAALAGHEKCRTIEAEDGSVAAWRFGALPAADKLAPAEAAPAERATLDLSPLPREILPPRPLSPSAAGAVADVVPEEGEPAESSEAKTFVSPVLSGSVAEPSLAIRRGILVHRLLQVLPERDPAEREAIAARYVAAQGAVFSETEQARLVASVLAVMAEPDFAPIFTPQSRAEVSVAGDVRFGGQTFRVSGTVDRLAVTETQVLIVDYKTNRPPPRSLEDVPQAYVTQLALYRALLQPLYPDKAVGAALLFTEAPRLIALPAERLDAALARKAPADGKGSGHGEGIVAAEGTER